jgi:hypothetical protein
VTHPTGPTDRPRAQGDERIPWPAGMIDEPDNCCVGLRVRVANHRPEGSLDVVLDLAGVQSGPALPTLLELISHRFSDAQRQILEFELDRIGWIDPQCPLRLERVTHVDERKIFVDALILPFGEQQAAELSELLRVTADPAERQAKAWQYVETLERRWEEQTYAGHIPRRYLDVDFVGRRGTAAAADDDEVLLPIRRAPLPAAL